MLGNNLAERFCQLVAESPEMSNATARIGAWMIGAAIKTGGFPLEISMRQVTHGFKTRGPKRDRIKVEGTGSKDITVRTALNWYEERGYLTSTQGEPRGFGSHARRYTLEI